MLVRRKTIPVIIMILIMGLPSLGFLYYQFRQFMIKHEMEEKMELASLQTVYLAPGEVNWYKKNKELLINGSLFDVKSAEKINDSLIAFTGLFDEEETAIKKEAEDIARRQHQKTNTHIAAGFISLLMIASDISQPEFKLPPVAETIYKPFTDNRSSSPPANIVIPPPEC